MGVQAAPRICEPGGEGIFFPLFEGETNVRWLAAIMYGVILLYFFLGVALIADIFMGSIDAVTGRRVQIVENGKVITSKVWNKSGNGSKKQCKLVSYPRGKVGPSGMQLSENWTRMMREMSGVRLQN